MPEIPAFIPLSQLFIFSLSGMLFAQLQFLHLESGRWTDLVEADKGNPCDVIRKNSGSKVRLSGFEFPLPCLANVVNMPVTLFFYMQS